MPDIVLGTRDTIMNNKEDMLVRNICKEITIAHCDECYDGT